jgi:hypothetical protein
VVRAEEAVVVDDGAPILAYGAGQDEAACRETAEDVQEQVLR